MGKIVERLKQLPFSIWWLLCRPIWQGILFLVGIVAVGVVILVLMLTFRSPGGEDTKPIPDRDSIVQPEHDDRLDVFREEWNIRGDFRMWPALLPLAKMSNLAYELESPADDEFAILGFDTVKIVDSPFHSQVAYIAAADDVLVVVFRGTDDTEDWFSNANMYLRHMAEGKIHSGFAGAYSMLKKQVLEEITKLKPKYIWITGHSLGGAMALVCAYDLVQYESQQPAGVITFGQPMICTEALAGFLQEKLGDRYVHFVNELDAVPQIPFGFSHCGLMLRFYRGKVQMSAKYLEKVVGDGPYGSPSDVLEIEPIAELPPLSQQRFEEFQRSYDGEKPVKFVPVQAQPPLMQSPTGPPMTTAPMAPTMSLPWKKDHSMELYVEKIRSAIQGSHGGK